MLDDPSVFVWPGLLIVCFGMMIYGARRQNLGLARQKEAMDVQAKAVAAQAELLATSRRLVTLAEEANRQRDALLKLIEARPPKA